VVQGDVASTYAGALAFKDRLAIARSNLELARQLLTLIEAQYAEGRTSALEVAQQRLTVSTQEAAIPTLEQQLRASENALAILLGRPPEGFRIEAASLTALALPQVAAGQPTDLLTRRPDIQKAEADLRAANADIGAARAAFFPTIDLTVEAAFTGLLSAGSPTTAATLASGLVAPIFSGGQLEGQLESTKARFAELVATYRQAVLVSLQEAEDALVAVDASGRRTGFLDEAVVQARDAFRLSQLRYVAGAVDFISVIDAQRSQLSAEDSLVQARLDRYNAAVDLFKALGGSWDAG
jgi:NodT family efflux transporter outer membrane factor (OMF) lipoprotein